MIKNKLSTLCKVALIGSALMTSSVMAQQTADDLDPLAAAKRLSGGIQFATISNQDRSDFDIKAFEDYHNYTNSDN